jgi:hypothetical protein
MFNVYKNQLSRQTGSRNLTCPKTLPTIWYTYMTLVTKYQISAINISNFDVLRKKNSRSNFSVPNIQMHSNSVPYVENIKSINKN